MALIERNGRVYARKLWIFLGASEWGNDLMRLVAREAFANDASLDAVQVHEHGGWYLTFLRGGTIVGIANDQAHLDDRANRRERFAAPDTDEKGMDAMPQSTRMGNTNEQLRNHTTVQPSPT